MPKVKDAYDAKTIALNALDDPCAPKPTNVEVSQKGDTWVVIMDYGYTKEEIIIDGSTGKITNR